MTKTINVSIDLFTIIRPLQPIEEEYKPVADNNLPRVEDLLNDIRTHLPGSVFLHAWEDQVKDPPVVAPPLSITPPSELLAEFFEQHTCSYAQCDCAQEFLDRLQWSAMEVKDTEQETRGQYKNRNWVTVRKGLITASKVKTICHCVDGRKTAEKILESKVFYGDDVPDAIKYGRNNESKALKMFVRTHRYHHRNCSFYQPGIFLSESEPFLAASPDGIVTCKHCGKFLVEVKCLYKNRNSHPKTAIKERDFCVQNSDGSYQLRQTHEYFYQIQCQMAVTGITTCYLVIFTNRGIESIKVPFDHISWKKTCETLCGFWKQFMFPCLKSKVQLAH